MLMNDYQGDAGTMDEDLAVLGLGTLTEARTTNGHAAGALHEDGQTQAEGEIPPQFKKHMKPKGSDADGDGKTGEGKGKPDFMKKKDDDSDDEDDDEDDDDEQDEDEDVAGEQITEDTMLDIDQMMEIAEEWEIEPIDFLDFLNESFGLDCAAFLTEDEMVELADGENLDEDEDGDDFGHKTEAAHAVLGSFYGQLEQIQEAEEVEEDDHPSYDNLVGVIESYEHVYDDLMEDVDAILEAENLDEAKKGFRRLKAKLRLGKRKFMKSAKGKKLKRVVARMHSRGMHLVGGVKMRAGQFLRSLRNKLKGAGGKFARSIRNKIAGARNSTVTSGRETVAAEGQSPLSELVSNLSALRSQVNEQDDVASASDELLEGLRSVHDVATSYFERIAVEVQEDENATEDDARVAVGRHLEKIAEDARRVAEGMVESDGEFTLDDYADDLTALAADLDDTMEAMKGIE